MAYPHLLIEDSTMYTYLTQMLWFDLVTEIFRQDGGLIRINNDGETFADHPFDEVPPCELHATHTVLLDIFCVFFIVGDTTLFFASEFPPLLPGEPPVVTFQSVLDPFNFLGVVRNPDGDLELVSDVRDIRL